MTDGVSSGIEIRTLEDRSAGELCESHNRAFSDYAVPIQMTPERLALSHRQNAVALDASFGAFDGAQLVGFWFNGLRSVDGVPCAYDAGTAIWPEYRGRGLSTRLAEASSRHLRERGVRRYRLEVLTENEKAFRIYEKDGFRVTRRFVCLTRRREGGAAPAENPAIRIEMVPFDAAMRRQLPPTEYEPSWQHSWDAMTAIAEAIRLVTARTRGQLVGYGLIQPSRGSIAQLGVAPGAWDDGSAVGLLRRLVGLSEAEDVRIINIDERAPRTLTLCASLGFETMATQYEMEKELVREGS